MFLYLKRFKILLFFLFSLWLLLPLVASCIGPLKLSFSEAISVFAKICHFLPQDNATSASYTIINQLRLPRAILALLCGGALACSGAILQGVLRNPLADPFTLGISAGGACGASIILGVISTHSPLVFYSDLTTIASFAGALVALFATLLLGRSKGNYIKENLILAGIAVSTFLGAIVTLIKALNEESVTSIVFWLMGSLQGRSWESIPVILYSIIPSILFLLFSWRKLDILNLGDEQARILGLSCGGARFFMLCAASLMASACVSICGIIAFIGLVTPHILRLSIGSGHGPLLVTSFFGGGVFLLLADCLARNILDGGQELPVGVVTALIGGPFFAFLIWKQK